jgi:hypothetical protein
LFDVFRRGLLAVAATVLLVACDGERAADPPADDDVSITDTSPATEETGPEEPRPEDEGVSLELPGLPVGGSDGPAERICATPSLLGDLPDGVSIEVTGVGFTQPGVFEQDGSSCGETKGCDESFVFPTDGSSCSVPVKAVASNGDTTGLTLSGVVRCAREDAGRCEDFVGETAAGQFQLTQSSGDDNEEQPPPEEGDTTTTTTS